MSDVGGSNGNSDDREWLRGATVAAATAADEMNAGRGLAQLVMDSGYQAPNV